jgi:hypothetical protein
LDSSGDRDFSRILGTPQFLTSGVNYANTLHGNKFGFSSLLIVEFILPPIVSHPDPQLEGHLMSDLNMLAVSGGRERGENAS